MVEKTAKNRIKTGPFGASWALWEIIRDSVEREVAAKQEKRHADILARFDPTGKQEQ